MLNTKAQGDFIRLLLFFHQHFKTYNQIIITYDKEKQKVLCFNE